MREGVRSYLYSLYISWRTGNLSRFRPKVLSYHRNKIVIGKGARLIVDGRVHLSTRPNTWPSSCYIELGPGSTLHFTGRASIRGEAHIILGPGARVVVGDRVILRERLWLAAHQEITIADCAGIGQDSTVIDSDVHPVVIDGELRPTQAPVHIGHHVWICAGCTILKGVTIGPETIVGAGSMVTRSLPDHCLAVGRPAVPVNRVAFGRYDPRIHQLPAPTGTDAGPSTDEDET